VAASRQPLNVSPVAAACAIVTENETCTTRASRRRLVVEHRLGCWAPAAFVTVRLQRGIHPYQWVLGELTESRVARRLGRLKRRGTCSSVY
jgi:hypothetical protein